jgi:hypothetical protein
LADLFKAAPRVKEAETSNFAMAQHTRALFVLFAVVLALTVALKCTICQSMMFSVSRSEISKMYECWEDEKRRMKGVF